MPTVRPMRTKTHSGGLTTSRGSLWAPWLQSATTRLRTKSKVGCHPIGQSCSNALTVSLRGLPIWAWQSPWGVACVIAVIVALVRTWSLLPCHRELPISHTSSCAQSQLGTCPTPLLTRAGPSTPLWQTCPATPNLRASTRASASSL